MVYFTHTGNSRGFYPPIGETVLHPPLNETNPNFNSPEHLKEVLKAWFKKCDEHYSVKLTNNGELQSYPDPQPYTVGEMICNLECGKSKTNAPYK